MHKYKTSEDVDQSRSTSSCSFKTPSKKEPETEDAGRLEERGLAPCDYSAIAPAVAKTLTGVEIPNF